MRVVIILVIVAAIVIGIQLKVVGGKSDQRYQAAVALLPGQPKKAYEEIKATFQMSNVMTLGKVRRNQRAFFAALRDKLISEISAQRDHNITWNTGLVEALEVLKLAQQEPQLGGGVKSSLADHQRAIFNELVARKDQIIESVGLKSWDSFTKSIAHMEQQGIINDQLTPGASDFVAAVQAVDRRDISHRETISIALTSLDAGVAALGLPFSSDVNGPLAAILDKKIPDEALLKAESEFALARRACEGFGRMFGAPNEVGGSPLMPPDIAGLWAKMVFNIGAMRTAHLIDLGPSGSSGVSYYLTKLYVKPGTDTIPTDSEIYSSFLNAVGDQLKTAATRFHELDDDALGGEKSTYLALTYWTMVGFGKVSGRKELSSLGVTEFQRWRNQAEKSKAGSVVMADLDQADFPLIVIR